MNVLEQIVNALVDEFADFQDVGEVVKLCTRLILAGVLGGVLGFERETRGKSAGVRTHMLVAVGTALFVAVPQFYGLEGDSISRVMQGVISGIGFLGAGSIIKNQAHDEVHGLTTAAGIWMTAAIGIAAGLGRASSAVVGAVLGLIVLRVFSRGANWLHARRYGDSAAKTAVVEPRQD